MKKIIYKNRQRTLRGPLQKFEDLPKDKQENFIHIKNKILEVLGKDVKVYVFGSYSHGFWDNESDYDVKVFPDEKVDISQVISELTKLKVNVFYLGQEMDFISIP